MLSTKNYIRGAIDYLRATVAEKTGLFLAPEEVIAKRYKACEQCEEALGREGKNLGKCNACGCFIMKKILLIDSECQRGKWNVTNTK